MARRLSRFTVFVLVTLVLARDGFGQKPPFPPVPAQGSTNPVPAPANEAMGKEILARIYQAELGKLYVAADLDRLMHGHQLIEDYFAATKSADRKAIVASLEQTNLAPGILGRLARIRMHWAALEPGVYYVNEKRGPHELRYFMGVPAGYDRTRAWPMVVKLAEPGAFMTEPPPDAARVAEIYTSWIKADLGAHPDAITLMPLLNLEGYYGPSQAGMNSVIWPMLDAVDRANVDPARVYLLGHGSAASAAWNLALQYPTYFAAIVPLAGVVPYDWQRIRLINLRNTLPVAWNDANDKGIRIELARSLVDALQAQKIDVDYLQTRGVGHNPTDSIVAERYKKMQSTARTLYPAHVSIQSDRPQVQFNRDDWLQIWQEASPAKDRRLVLRNGEVMILHETPSRIDATNDQNQLDLTVENVGSLRIFLNDQMVDFGKPISINVNKRKKAQGFIHQSIDQMLNDQILLGRGWRYYTATMDVDLVEPPASRPTTRPATQPRGKGRIIVGPDPAK